MTTDPPGSWLNISYRCVVKYFCLSNIFCGFDENEIFIRRFIIKDWSINQSCQVSVDQNISCHSSLVKRGVKDGEAQQNMTTVGISKSKSNS